MTWPSLVRPALPSACCGRDRVLSIPLGGKVQQEYLSSSHGCALHLENEGISALLAHQTVFLDHSFSVISFPVEMIKLYYK